MKRFLVFLSVLALLLIAGPAQSDWIDDIMPLPDGVNFVGLDFSGDAGIVTLKTEDGICINYKVVNDKVVKTKKCNDTNWKDYYGVEEE